MATPNIYSDDWRIVNEVPEIDDAEHRTMKAIGLTVAGCDCHRCCHLRDRSIVGMQPFGDEDDRALKAVDRMNQRTV